MEFDFLDRYSGDIKRKKNGQLDIREHNLHPIDYAEYLIKVNKKRKSRDFYDLSDIIEISFNKCQGVFGSKEFDFISDYWFIDFNIALEAAHVCLSDSDIWHKRIYHRQSRTNHLNYASVLVNRAKETVSRAEIMLPFNNVSWGWDYDNSYKEIERLSQEVSLAIKFPKNHKEISRLQSKINEAIQEECYEMAILYRNEIKKLTT